MKKVAIITLHGKGQRNNYGNLLQNYAVQEILKKFDFCVETIPETSAYLKNQNKLKLNKKIRKSIKEILNIRYKSLDNKRKKEFKKFEEKFIKKSKFTINKITIPKELNNSYDYFITGSDQVWNPYYNYNSPAYFLDFCTKKKRIALSPSFGITNLPNNIKDEYTKYLNGFEYLSVREDSGRKIIEELTGKKASVLIDPTLMLSKQEWNNISIKPKKVPNKKYIMVYFLGKIKNDEKLYLQELSKRYDLEIVNILDRKQKEYYISSPSQFIWLIEHAELIFTDSFHGSVFSIIYKKPFIVFDRKSKFNMNSRLETLLNKFNLLNRKYSQIDINQILNIDYIKTYEILKKEQDKFYEYIENNLNQNDNIQ